MSLAEFLIQKYNAAKMNDPRFPHIAVEVPVREKTHKYKRFAHEKRSKRTPGMKRVETPHIMVTKWDVENANKRNKKIGTKNDAKRNSETFTRRNSKNLHCRFFNVETM